MIERVNGRCVCVCGGGGAGNSAAGLGRRRERGFRRESEGLPRINWYSESAGPYRMYEDEGLLRRDV